MEYNGHNLIYLKTDEVGGQFEYGQFEYYHCEYCGIKFYKKPGASKRKLRVSMRDNQGDLLIGYIFELMNCRDMMIRDIIK